MKNPPPLLGIAGDWHGNYQWAHSMIKRLHTHGVSTILHLGDFGIWPGGSGTSYLNNVNYMLDSYGMHIWVTPGNHEDYNQIEAGIAKDGVGDLWYARPRITVMGRGHRWQFAGSDLTFLSLGGAPSIDRKYRSRNSSWWPQEQVTDADVARAVSGGPVDVMLTHDSPNNPYWTPAVEAICSNNGGIEPGLLSDLIHGRDQISYVYEAVRPKFLFHGHYHALSRRENEIGTVWSLNCDHEDGNIGVFNTEDLTFELVD